MTRLIAHEFVLDIEQAITGKDPIFTSPDDMEVYPSLRVTLPRSTWEDMGHPTVITVRVVPGDALNEED